MKNIFKKFQNESNSPLYERGTKGESACTTPTFSHPSLKRRGRNSLLPTRPTERNQQSFGRASYLLLTSRGFTLVETLVALAIFTTAVVGMISLTASGINDTRLAKNKIVATALSQEGIEMVRNIRDNYLLSAIPGNADDAWNNFRDQFAGCADGNYCDINPTYVESNYDDPSSIFKTCSLTRSNPTVIQFNDETECRLHYDVTTGYFTDTQGTQTPFVRLINVFYPYSYETDVYSHVLWLQGDTVQKVTSRENLMKWYLNI
jgi:prepilin-type N-terminal cleavage/methylation domain-containing protein